MGKKIDGGTVVVDDEGNVSTAQQRAGQNLQRILHSDRTV